MADVHEVVDGVVHVVVHVVVVPGNVSTETSQ